MCDKFVCGFVQRSGTRKVPCVGLISEIIGGVFIKRTSTKEERARVLEKIKVRQSEAE
jgi:hypothetical protein